MTEIIKESVTSENDGQTEAVTTEVKSEASGSQTIEYVVYYLFGALDILLLSRFLLKITGANASNGFVSFIYDVTRIFVLPFQGIFGETTAENLENNSVFEPSVLIAIVVYAVVAWGIVKLIRIFSGEKQE
jgi:hypothetical protein